MQKIKILIFIVLLSIGFSFNGELYMLYLDNFQESYYQANFYPDRPSRPVTDVEIIRDFMDASEENDVDFFVVDHKIQSAYKTEITIYGTERALAHLQSQDIKEGKNESLFFGEAVIRYEPFQKIKEISKCDKWYFIGGKEKKKALTLLKPGLLTNMAVVFPSKKGRIKKLGSICCSYGGSSFSWR